MIRCIENSSIIRTVYPDIFKHIQYHPAVFSRVQAYWRTLRHNEVYSGITGLNEPYPDIFRTLDNSCLYNHTIFRTLAHLELEASSKACWTHKVIRHIQSPGIVRKVYSSILKDIRDIQGYWCKFSFTLGAQLMGKGEGFPCHFLNWKMCSDFGKRVPDCVHFGVKFSIQNVILRVSRRENVLKCPSSTKPPLLQNIYDSVPAGIILFAKCSILDVWQCS